MAQGTSASGPADDDQLRTPVSAPALLSPINGHRYNGTATVTNTAAHTNGIQVAPKPPSSASIPFFKTGSNTTPETSLVGARGKSIPLDDSTAAHRTSALRELNSSFPSPVLRHQQAKSTGAQSTTYSQPVIVRTYSGPPQSPSTSAHYRPPSSSRRAGSRASGSRRILYGQNGQASSWAWDSTANSSNNAQSVGWGLANSLFGMARSKGKKGGFIPWPFVAGTDGPSQKDEAKLPPIEAFSYKGFMADLQTTTDIRSDLDRIAEICARSRYCLSDKYDSHVTPHGSGATFMASVSQHPNHSTGRRKGASSPGGPTLQAVPSDDDETSARGHRRRRGGIGGGRRRSAAYGTLETIMSSSRSSEEDKSKKKSAADITEAVRGRAARKGLGTADSTGDSTATTTGESSGRDKTSSNSSKSPRGEDGDRKGSRSPKESSRTNLVDGDKALLGSSGPLATSRSSPDRQQVKLPRRPKSTSFAHAVIGSSRKNQRHRHSAGRERSSAVTTHPVVDVSNVPALLSEPALPQTSDGAIDMYNVLSDTVNGQASPHPTPHHSRRSNTLEHRIHIVDPDDEANQDPSLFLDPEDATEAGFFSGLTHWIPWMANGTGGPIAEQPLGNGRSPSHYHEVPAPVAAGRASVAGPSHAEGSLRELLKGVEDRNGKLKKGKAVDDNTSR
ncbi:hypothetical protein SPBR_06744 [Sporothrix brasiliensis 5110]|uniref:Uncharacterized protein n=1 Tax=Sporothrix brasiliensis 5110 TaxID=1398154 RepID=A0A0C2ISR1_9PEZI|nr:uncharacterized protein SPBR_06744 [Sporothrix brasiliensis 5110]KIH88022.1 hypothetical protein SPBR_06744 [Sporothrix brasiliensis 5110]